MSDAHLRLSDAERDRAAAELGEHYAQGRLTPEEHAERLDRVWAARTRGELPPIFRDLPGPVGQPGPVPPPRAWAPAAAAGSWPGAGRAGRRARPGLPAPLLALLVALVVIAVATHLPLIVAGLVVWLLLTRRHRWHGSARYRSGPVR